MVFLFPKSALGLKQKKKTVIITQYVRCCFFFYYFRFRNRSYRTFIIESINSVSTHDRLVGIRASRYWWWGGEGGVGGGGGDSARFFGEPPDHVLYTFDHRSVTGFQFRRKLIQYRKSFTPENILFSRGNKRTGGIIHRGAWKLNNFFVCIYSHCTRTGCETPFI